MSLGGRDDGAQLAAGIALIVSGIFALCVILAMISLGYSTVTRLLVVVAAALSSSGLWYLAARSRWRGRFLTGVASVLHVVFLFGLPMLAFVWFPTWARITGPLPMHGSTAYAVWSGVLYGTYFSAWSLVLRRRSGRNGGR